MTNAVSPGAGAGRSWGFPLPSPPPRRCAVPPGPAGRLCASRRGLAAPGGPERSLLPDAEEGPWSPSVPCEREGAQGALVLSHLMSRTHPSLEGNEPVAISARGPPAPRGTARARLGTAGLALWPPVVRKQTLRSRRDGASETPRGPNGAQITGCSR